MLTYSCDFETTTDPNDTRVWVWGAYEIETKQFEWGKDIDSFFRFSRK